MKSVQNKNTRNIERLLTVFYNDVLKGKVISSSITRHAIKEWLKENADMEIIKKTLNENK